ncbi:MAG: hypothetical protein JOZ51_24755 [Chloroflexi bacterium]|nr:hypothetical protein [Chloroflexota bacterium]
MTSYLQRIVARMGTPTAGVGLLFTPPEAQAPAIFDPFAEAEPLDEPIASLPFAPQTTDPPALPPAERVERSELLPPGSVVERVIHEFEGVAPSAPLLPPAAPPATDLPLAPPAPVLEPPPDAPPIETTAWQTVEQIMQQFITPAADAAPPSLERPNDALPPLLPAPEIEERISYEFVESPRQEPPVSTVQPPIEAEAPAVGPIFESPAPQITIGDIVVEIVPRPEAAGRTPPPAPPRAVQPAEPPAPLRAGVRSKRGYGMGQI